jgi:hypothetical protein
LLRVVSQRAIEEFRFERVLLDTKQPTALTDVHLPAIEARIGRPEIGNVELVHVRISLLVSQDFDAHPVEVNSITHK